MTMSLCEGGKLRLLRPGVIEHWCPGCSEVHAINVHEKNHNGKLLGWDGDERYPSIAEAVRHVSDKGHCEYVLRAGVQYFMNNCWHPLAGQMRHLQEFPR
jgi:hypothetical protein